MQVYLKGKRSRASLTSLRYPFHTFREAQTGASTRGTRAKRATPSKRSERGMVPGGRVSAGLGGGGRAPAAGLPRGPSASRAAPLGGVAPGRRPDGGRSRAPCSAEAVRLSPGLRAALGKARREDGAVGSRRRGPAATWHDLEPPAGRARPDFPDRDPVPLK